MFGGGAFSPSITMVVVSYQHHRELGLDDGWRSAHWSQPLGLEEARGCETLTTRMSHGQTNVGEDVEETQTHVHFVGVGVYIKWYSCYGEVWQILKKLYTELIYDSNFHPRYTTPNN